MHTLIGIVLLALGLIIATVVLCCPEPVHYGVSFPRSIRTYRFVIFVDKWFPIILSLSFLTIFAGALMLVPNSY